MSAGGVPRFELSLHDTFIAKPYSLDDLLVQIAELLNVELELAGVPSEQMR